MREEVRMMGIKNNGKQPISLHRASLSREEREGFYDTSGGRRGNMSNFEVCFLKLNIGFGSLNRNGRV